MKRAGILTGLLLCAGSVCGQGVTLEECYALARENYPQVRRYGLIARAEKYDLSSAARAWIPSVGVSGKASWQSAVTKLPFDASQLPAELARGLDMVGVSKDQYQAAVEVDQTIWDGGLSRATREVTRAQAESDRAQLEGDLYALNDRVNNLYFGCLLQDELLRQNGLLQEILQVNLQRVDALIANGVANLSDRETMQVELLNARQQAVSLRASRTAFARMLGAMTGRERMDTLKLAVPAMPSGALPVQVDRPELKALEAQDRLLESKYKGLDAGLSPRLGAFMQGGYGRPGLNMLDNSFQPFFVAGVRLSWTLGRFYTLRNDRGRIRNGQQQVGVQRDTFLYNIRLEQLQQHSEIRKMDELILSDGEIVALRESIRQAAVVKLENGVISATDLVREINNEDQARQSAAIHRVQRLSAVYDYLYTNGTNNE